MFPPGKQPVPKETQEDPDSQIYLTGNIEELDQLIEQNMNSGKYTMNS